MNTTKQTIVEMRFPITREVLEMLQLTPQQEGNDIFFKYVYVTEGSPKEAVGKARDYFNALFKKSLDVRVTQSEVKQSLKPNEQHVEQTTDIKKYTSEDNVV